MKDWLKNPQFEVCNRTSVSHLFIAALGFNGSESSSLAITIAEMYCKWLSKTERRSISDDYPPTAKSIDDMISYTKDYVATDKSQSYTKSNIERLMNELFDRYRCN
jgi:hypothetical protein